MLKCSRKTNKPINYFKLHNCVKNIRFWSLSSTKHFRTLKKNSGNYVLWHALLCYTCSASYCSLSGWKKFPHSTILSIFLHQVKRHDTLPLPDQTTRSAATHSENVKSSKSLPSCATAKVFHLHDFSCLCFPCVGRLFILTQVCSALSAPL